MSNRFTLTIFLNPVAVANLAEDMPKCALRNFMKLWRLLVGVLNNRGALAFGQI
jgi:hypothetical protein